MADFVEFDDFGNSGGGGGDLAGEFAGVRRGGAAAGDGEVGEMQEQEGGQRDAVLFLVDCRESMFSPSATAGGGSGGGVRGDDAEKSSSPFANAVKCALSFYADKVITSDRDLVGVLLFGTKQQLNAYAFPHIYVFHELDCPSAPRVQELDCLARCGCCSSGGGGGGAAAAGYASFQRSIGHCPGSERAPLSEALWAAQHMLNRLPKSVGTRRVFIFTDAEDPPGGDALERERCFARMRDFYEAGIEVEVWAHGFDPTAAAPGAAAAGAPGAAPSAASACGATADSGTPNLPLSSATAPRSVIDPSSVTSSGGGGGGGGGSASLPFPPSAHPTPLSHVATTTTSGGDTDASSGALSKKCARLEAPAPGMHSNSALRPFNASSFWAQLLAVPQIVATLRQREQRAGALRNAEGATAALLASALGSSSGGGSSSSSSGHPSTLLDRFADPAVASSILRAACGSGEGVHYTGRVHVADFSSAATFTNILAAVRERVWAQRTTGRLELRVGTGASAPRLLVGAYLPVMPCKKPTFTWVEAATNAVVTCETQRVLKATGAIVRDQDILSAARVGPTGGGTAAAAAASEVTFTREEVALMRGQFGSKGLTILGFRDRAATLRFKHAISRAAFVHPITDESENAESVRFFAQLHRALAARSRVAIAQLIARPGAAPRLVALAPNVEQRDEAVLGMGFHVIYLPYADDIRSVRVNDPAHPRSVVGPDDPLVVKAKKVIRELTNDSHDYKAVENPVLQRQYHVLQQLALCDESRPPPEDATLPDTEGMSRPRVRAVLQDFSAAAFDPGYAASTFCPAQKASKPPPSADELAQIDFDDLERRAALNGLTVPHLKQYLKQHRVDSGAAKVKADFVELVAATVRRQRAGDGGSVVKVKDESDARP